MKGKAILIITAVVLIGLTAGAYSILVSEWTAALQLSLAVVCISELIAVCTFGLATKATYKNGVVGTMVIVYAALMLLWSLIGLVFPEKAFHIGYLAISAVMLVAIGISVFSTHEAEKINNDVEAAIDKKRNFTSGGSLTPTAAKKSSNDSLTAMWLKMQNSITDPALLNKIRVLVERIQAMPANSFPNQTIEDGMRDIFAMSQSINVDHSEANKEEIINNIREITNYIKSL